MPSVLLFSGVLLLAAALRWLLACTVYLLPNSDQVMVGLMARQMLAGDWPVFYWGQPYNGTLESAVTAAVFRLFGPSDVALHVAPILFSLMFVAATMNLGYQIYGRSVALLTGCYLALGPALLIGYSVWPGYNYLEAMAFGTLALTLVLPIGQDARWRRLPPATFLLGLALWAQPLAIVYVPAIAVLVAGPAVHTWRTRHGRRRVLGAGAAALATLVLALLPAIGYNLHHRPTTLGFLTGRPNHLHMTLAEETRRLVLWAAPVLTGLIPPAADPAQFQRFLEAHQWLYGLALALPALALLPLAQRRQTLLRWGSSLATARPTGQGALLTMAIALLGAYLFSTWSSSLWSATDPRYLLPLFTLAPLLVRMLFPPGASRWRLLCGGCLASLMVMGGLAANGSAPRVDSMQHIATYLQARGDEVIYGDYWLVYPITFASNERITPVVVTPTLALGLNRYLPYLRAGLRARVAAWGVPAGSATERALLRCLAEYRLAYGRRTFVLASARWVLLDRISSGAHCVRGYSEATVKPAGSAA